MPDSNHEQHTFEKTLIKIKSAILVTSSQNMTGNFCVISHSEFTSLEPGIYWF